MIRTNAETKSDPDAAWRFRGRSLIFTGRLRIMGVVNVTPDSFSDGGCWATPAAASERACALVDEGADVVDIGGESTRPGAAAVTVEEEAERVYPVVRAVRLARPDAMISVDTRKAAVAEYALAAGADIINDVSALGDPDMARVVRAAEAGLVLMHMQGEPATMQENPFYEDVVAEVRAFLEQRMAMALRAGIPADHILLDPGIGFGKNAHHNLALLRSLDRLAALGRPVLVGVSRKRIVGALTGRPVDARDAGSLGLLAWVAARGAAMARVHDVRGSVDVARIIATMEKKERPHYGLV